MSNFAHEISNILNKLIISSAMKLLTLSIMLAATMSAAAQQKQNFNMPIIQTKYTADPAPYVHGDTVYLYTTHDEDDAEGFKMKEIGRASCRERVCMRV